MLARSLALAATSARARQFHWRESGDVVDALRLAVCERQRRARTRTHARTLARTRLAARACSKMVDNIAAKLRATAATAAAAPATEPLNAMRTRTKRWYLYNNTNNKL